MAPKTKRYEKKDPISHCLDRPDMYVGSVRLRNIMEYIAQKQDDASWKIFQEEINSSPAILRIFVEALSNAVDNVERSKGTTTPCTMIKVTINEETGETSIWNDGDVVPIEMNEEEKCYNHSMIFGQLLTGSNYNDEEERVTAGRNGLGIKLVSIFSTKFQVEGCDPAKKLILTQDWTDNMRKTSEPTLRSSRLKGYTKVTWTPDFSRFGLTKYTADIIKLYHRYIIDAAMISKIKLYLDINFWIDILDNSKCYVHTMINSSLTTRESMECLLNFGKGSTGVDKNGKSIQGFVPSPIVGIPLPSKTAKGDYQNLPSKMY